MGVEAGQPSYMLVAQIAFEERFAAARARPMPGDEARVTRPVPLRGTGYDRSWRLGATAMVRRRAAGCQRVGVAPLLPFRDGGLAVQSGLHDAVGHSDATPPLGIGTKGLLVLCRQLKDISQTFPQPGCELRLGRTIA